MKKVYIVNSSWDYENMWTSMGYEVVSSLEKADIVQFTGGADVSPHLYGEVNVRSWCDANRDIYEQKIFELVLKMGLPMVGICRGGQFLNVMNGGRMWQHVNNHAIGGTHGVLDIPTGKVYQCTSTHHQMMRPKEGADLIGTGYNYTVDDEVVSTQYTDEYGTEIFSLLHCPLDVEVLWYEDTRCLCFQPHPEFEEGECRDYFSILVRRYFG